LRLAPYGGEGLAVDRGRVAQVIPSPYPLPQGERD
jgi:hypothetical protein